MANSEHLTRWKSAAIMLAVIFLVGIIDNKVLTWAFFGVVLYFAFDEASRLWGYKKEDKDIVLLAIVWAVALVFKVPILFLPLIFITLASKLAYNKSVDKRVFLVYLYPVASIFFIWNLYLDFKMISLVWLLIIVALTDVGAYYVGKNFGKTPFSPTSPNKTLEGVFGGIATASVIGAILIASSSDIGFFGALIIALLSSIASVFGDLFESYLKREAGVKDSGNLIPGHGGILDRIDGYLFASVVLYILLIIKTW